MGLDGLSKTQAERVRVGNALAEVAATLMKVQHAAGNLVQLEQPARSLMILYEPIKKALASTEAVGYQRDACVDGAPWRNPLILYTPTRSVGLRMAAKCPGCKDHIRLRVDPDGNNWTRVARPYWPAWARSVARKWAATVISHVRKIRWKECAPMMITAVGSSSIEALLESRHTPAGGRSMEKAADTMAGGLQPTRKKLPQLLPDGLTPDMHPKAAMMVQHPLTYAPSTTDPVKYALKWACEDADQTMAKRQ